MLALYGITAFHPLVHNLVLLGITPTYRAIIVAALRKIRGRALGGVQVKQLLLNINRIVGKDIA